MYKRKKTKNAESEWKVKPDKDGFLEFHLAGTNSYQHEFPTFFDDKTGKSRPMFVHKWRKKRDQLGRKFWQHSETGFKQYEKPDKQTYILEAAITNNLAFLDLYIKSRGSLSITD